MSKSIQLKSVSQIILHIKLNQNVAIPACYGKWKASVKTCFFRGIFCFACCLPTLATSLLLAGCCPEMLVINQSAILLDCGGPLSTAADTSPGSESDWSRNVCQINSK